MKTEYHMLDGDGGFRALRLALADMHLAPRPATARSSGTES